MVGLGYSRLEFAERTEIHRRLVLGESVCGIAGALGRDKSTISREVSRNGGRFAYRPLRAHRRAAREARRPKPFKLERHPALARLIESKLRLRWSPEQIAGWLRRCHPHDPRWWVSPETIYQSLYVQARGELKAELTRYLRTRRSRRRTPGTGQGRGQLHDMVLISERPAEINDRAIPGHWEGDLLLGGPYSQIATLVERVSRYAILVHLPTDRTAPTVAAALTRVVEDLPAHLMRSITWDQGKEMAGHANFTISTGVPVYFCDPGKPWQRGTNENTNGLLRQYFPKGTDLSTHSADTLAAVAATLNGRPRKTLGWKTPAEALDRCLSEIDKQRVATTD